MQDAFPLMVDLSHRILQIEAQISQIKPIAENLTRLLSRDGNDSKAIRGYQMVSSENRINQSESDQSCGKSIQSISSQMSGERSKYDWIKSLGLEGLSLDGNLNAHYISLPDVDINRRSSVRSVLDRDCIFREAEMKEKEKSIWSRAKKTNAIEGQLPNKAEQKTSSDSRPSKFERKNSIIEYNKNKNSSELTKSRSRLLTGNAKNFTESSSKLPIFTESTQLTKKRSPLQKSFERSSSFDACSKLSISSSADQNCSNNNSQQLSNHSSTFGEDGLIEIEQNEDLPTIITIKIDSDKSPQILAQTDFKNGREIPIHSKQLDPIKNSAIKLDVNKSPSMKRKNSFAFVALADAATTAKYNAKGSLASLNHNKAASIKREEIESSSFEEISFRSILKQGLNPLSSFNVSLDFYMALIYISVVWIVPLKLGFAISVHWAYSVILTASFAFDTFIEFFTFKNTHPVLLQMENPTIKNWQSYYFRRNFSLDLISSLPLELLPVANCEYLLLLRFLRIYKLPHIMNSSPKFIAARKSMETALGIGQTFSGIIPLTFALCTFLHIESCAIFLLGTLTDFSNSGIAQVQYKSIGDQYTWALFNAVGNTFPMTYKPITSAEQLTVLVFIIVGAAL
ncbi:hypothetical protein HK100_000966, partial [Physocladia obscura]